MWIYIVEMHFHILADVLFFYNMNCSSELFKSHSFVIDPEKHKGWEPQTASSVTLVGTENYECLAGTVEWVAKSPFRPHHKRRNWFLNVTVLEEMQPIPNAPEFKIAYFHCGGNGGQNVNKVETGVRLTYVMTGITVTATEERTQQLNRQLAMKKIKALLAQGEKARKQQQKMRFWQSHQRLERGNPIRIYEGERFQRTK